MKEHISDLIQAAVSKLQSEQTLPADVEPRIAVERTKDKSHGDWASNIALTLAKPAKTNPRELAQKIVEALPESAQVVKTDIAGPGFINFFIDEASSFNVIQEILQQKQSFGESQIGAGQKIQVEFVSANPTGPLHVGHGRGAAYGATVASLLKAVGYEVHREYYVNDAGRQMDILATSIWLRYLASCGEKFDFPSNGYKGEYVKDIAEELHKTHGKELVSPAADVFKDVPADEPQGGDKEKHIDALIEKAHELLHDQYVTVFNAGLDAIIEDIRDDLGEFAVNYDEWFSERSLTNNADVERAISILEDKGHVYEKEGALWFKATAFGDDKDRVVKRDNGQTTYFASDIAYHLNKFERGFNQIINIWGADHHGYVARVKAALTALGLDAEKLIVRLVQFAILYRGKERVQMSTRSGSFVTLRELRDEVGADAARFFYVTRKSEQHMDFDLELAKSESKDNPVYYIQYAHARVCSVMRKLQEQNLSWNSENGIANLDKLTESHEKALVDKLSAYPEVLNNAATAFEPHVLAHYLRELAGDFHTYYNAHKVLMDDDQVRDARLTLSEAVRQVIANGLTLLGVSAPEAM